MIEVVPSWINSILPVRVGVGVRIHRAETAGGVVPAYVVISVAISAVFPVCETAKRYAGLASSGGAWEEVKRRSTATDWPSIGSGWRRTSPAPVAVRITPRRNLVTCSVG